MKRLLLLLPLLLALNCSYPELKDVIPPVTAVVFPYEGAVISGNVEVNVLASDNKELSKVWYFVDGIKMGERSRSPYTFTLDISGLARKVNHVIQSAAQDKDGNTAYSPTVNFTVAETPDIIPPTVAIVNPIGGQVVEGTVHVTAYAQDERSVQKVAFFIDGDSVGQKASYPYIFNWKTDTLSDSTAHTIFAKAFDTGNNSAVSPTVSVTVYPRTGPSGDNIPPTALFLYPITGTIVHGTVKVAVDLRDNTGVDSTAFYVDGQLTRTAKNPDIPWTFNWDTASKADSSTHSLYVKAYDAAENVGTSGLLIITIQ